MGLIAHLTKPMRGCGLLLYPRMMCGRVRYKTSFVFESAVVAAFQQKQSLLYGGMRSAQQIGVNCRALGRQNFHTSLSLWSEQVIKTPAFPESITEGDIKFTCKVGDSFNADDAVMEIETDKTSIPVPAPFAGSITQIMVTSGDTVKAGQELFKMKPGAAPAGAAPRPAAAAPPPAPAPVAAPRPAPAPAPVAAAPKLQVRSPQPTSKPGESAVPQITGNRAEQRVKLSRMRLKIAARLKEAQNTCAMLTTFNEIDMSFSMNFRKEKIANFTKTHNVKLGFMSLFSRASVTALKDQPVVNAVIENKLIIYREFVDISVAVASPRGLVVPVIRNVESMRYAEIEKTLAGLADKAKRDAITIEDMQGGTFTISNGGVFGSLMGTPIINPPQSAILGMHGIFPRPIAVKNDVVIRPMMYVALTYDHRIIDGREAVLFLRRIKTYLESPDELASGL